MAKLSLTRRSFLKASAMAGAAATVGFAAAPSAALAEGADPTAGEVKRIRSCCRACGKVECGTWVTVQDNKVIKVEGMSPTLTAAATAARSLSRRCSHCTTPIVCATA